MAFVYFAKESVDVDKNFKDNFEEVILNETIMTKIVLQILAFDPISFKTFHLQNDNQFIAESYHSCNSIIASKLNSLIHLYFVTRSSTCTFVYQWHWYIAVSM